MPTKVVVNSQTGEAVEVEMTSEEIAEFTSTEQQIEEEINRRLDEEVNTLDRQGDIIAALAKTLYQVAKQVDPSLTPEQFRTLVRNNLR